MTPRALQRSGLPLFILAAIVFALAVGVVFLVANPFAEGGLFERTRPTSPRPGTETLPADSETEPEPPPQATRVSRHSVVRGDTLYDLAGSYWSDPYLWPLILAANQDTVRDPDLLRPGSVLELPPSPLEDGELSQSEVAAVSRAHILAHERYRTLGEQSLAAGRESGNPWAIQQGLIRINKSDWVLYSGLRYDAQLLERAEGRVSADVISVVQSFQTRFGPRPGGE